MWGISITIHRNNFLQDSIYPEITYDAMMLRIRLLPGGFIRILLSEKRKKALTLTFFFITIYRSFDAVCYEIKDEHLRGPIDNVQRAKKFLTRAVFWQKKRISVVITLKSEA